MALELETLKLHCNVSDATDNAVLSRLLSAAQKHVERLLGYAFSDTETLPNGASADLEQAVYMLAAHWYENREASIAGVTSMTVPFSVSEIVNEHRNYSFGLCDNG